MQFVKQFGYIGKMAIIICKKQIINETSIILPNSRRRHALGRRSSQHTLSPNIYPPLFSPTFLLRIHEVFWYQNHNNDFSTLVFPINLVSLLHLEGYPYNLVFINWSKCKLTEVFHRICRDNYILVESLCIGMCADKNHRLDLQP